MKYEMKLNYLCRKLNKKHYLVGEGKCFEMNEMGTEVLKKFDDGMDFDQVVKAIAVDYDVQQDVVENDVKETLEFLLVNGILEEC